MTIGKSIWLDRKVDSMSLSSPGSEAYASQTGAKQYDRYGFGNGGRGKCVGYAPKCVGGMAAISSRPVQDQSGDA